MEIGYFFAGLVLIAVVALIVYLIRRNQKDEKKFEKDLNRSELRPDKHDDEQI
ncbi:FeoB-associated Cys-rich membrane protein [Arcticibacter eurypsychrophilus]|uniref:FeoB-associated Cys-rich membrane protein n=1 Tax=Arcticibacter eurypsychrophilus TaxID=1434752 RepID=UPI00147F3141|nr:FeoB-associated Cys-rich membrane protein [Arcticibacter eurypsychrophilus]